VSGPSGSGKSTLVQQLVKAGEFPLYFSVSATTRPPRAGEVDGRDYRFVSRDEFLALRDQGAFLESAEVFGNFYGTLRAPVDEALASGRWVLLEIDVQGHEQVTRLVPEAVSFFVRAPSPEALEQRVRRRSTETDGEIGRRIDGSAAEMRQAAKFDYQIVNETIEQAVRTFRTLLWGIKALGGKRL
jgi:guanylate kinase